MGFRFTLETVLRFREGLEKNEERALQKIQLEVAQVRRQLDELAGDLARSNSERADSLRNWMQAFRLQNLDSEIAERIATKAALLEMLGSLKLKRDEQMKRYQAARVDRRMLSDLEEQKKVEWEQERDRMDQKRMDDVFSSRLKRG